MVWQSDYGSHWYGSCGPEGVDPSFCVVWLRFRMLRRCLAYRPDETATIGRLLELINGGAPGHGPFHLLMRSAAEIGSRWCSDEFCWIRPALPRLPMVDGLLQHFKNAVVDAWRDCNSADLCRRNRVRCGPFLDYHWSMHLLVSSMLGTETRRCCEGSFLEVSGIVFSLSRCVDKTFVVDFVAIQTVTDILFRECSYHPHVHLRESLEFHYIVNLDRTNWPRCLLWHGCLPELSCWVWSIPWAGEAGDVALNSLETALGSCVDADRDPFQEMDLGSVERNLAANPVIWSDGNLVLDKVSVVGVAGSGVYAHASVSSAWFPRRWGDLDLQPPLPDGGSEAYRFCCSFPDPLQTVQLAEIWDVLVALQGCMFHVGQIIAGWGVWPTLPSCQ